MRAGGMLGPVDDVAKLEFLLPLFFGCERPEISQFRKAVEQFTADLPTVLEELRSLISNASGRTRRSARCKEKRPRDPTIREQLNT